MNLRLQLTRFLDDWSKSVKEGIVSNLTGSELAVLDLFIEFCEEETDDNGNGGASSH